MANKTTAAPAASLPAPHRAEVEGAYDSVSLNEGWGVLSLVLFVSTLFTRFLVAILPPALQGWSKIPPHAVTAVPILAFCGIVAALIGGRRQSATCRLGFVLNLVVLILGALLMGMIVMWRLSR